MSVRVSLPCPLVRRSSDSSTTLERPVGLSASWSADSPTQAFALPLVHSSHRERGGDLVGELHTQVRPFRWQRLATEKVGNRSGFRWRVADQLRLVVLSVPIAL